MKASPRWQLALGACACAAASAYVYAVDPANGGYPSCLLYRATGLYCAGCGATRACHALLHGRVLDALHDNVLFVALLPVALALLLPAASAAWRNNSWPAMTMEQGPFVRRALGLVALALLFATLRNIPGAPFDWLRPLS
jgi:hypothetical protein